MRFIEWLLEWFRAIPGEDGLSEWVDHPHDPQIATRQQMQDAIDFEKWRPLK